MRELHCRDIGFDCDAVVKAESDDELLLQAASHAKDTHGVTVTPEMAADISTKIRDVPESVA